MPCGEGMWLSRVRANLHARFFGGALETEPVTHGDGLSPRWETPGPGSRAYRSPPPPRQRSTRPRRLFGATFCGEHQARSQAVGVLTSYGASRHGGPGKGIMVPSSCRIMLM